MDSNVRASTPISSTRLGHLADVTNVSAGDSIEKRASDKYASFSFQQKENKQCVNGDTTSSAPTL
ncbi:hypothetical protein E2562_006714, partial [Oryza meyeriana var. granulata]